jgi:hypothetical protein
MKIEMNDPTRFRNSEHFQFHTEFRDAVIKHTPEALKIEAQFTPYLVLYSQADEALKRILKSSVTKEIQDYDRVRDSIYRGMVDTVKAAHNHFNAGVRDAARRVQIVLDTYGNLAAKPLNEQTADIYNLLQDLNSSKYLTDAGDVKIVEWMEELKTANQTFDTLMKHRYEEGTTMTDLKLKEVRLQIDAQYRTIAERINALVIVEGAEDYEDFIKFMNLVIEKYNNILAQRQGRKKVDSGELKVESEE